MSRQSAGVITIGFESAKEQTDLWLWIGGIKEVRIGRHGRSVAIDSLVPDIENIYLFGLFI